MAAAASRANALAQIAQYLQSAGVDLAQAPTVDLAQAPTQLLEPGPAGGGSGGS
ncbi:MAG: hypothetical protein IRY83_15290, partial [Chloroflexi bacterium]|nr:hypothetical protein [Chloroflexota bacterium]